MAKAIATFGINDKEISLCIKCIGVLYKTLEEREIDPVLFDKTMYVHDKIKCDAHVCAEPAIDVFLENCRDDLGNLEELIISQSTESIKEKIAHHKSEIYKCELDLLRLTSNKKLYDIKKRLSCNTKLNTSKKSE